MSDIFSDDRSSPLQQRLAIEQKKFSRALQADEQFEVLKEILQNIKRLKRQIEVSHSSKLKQSGDGAYNAGSTNT